MPFRHRHDLLGVFTRQRVACNLLMLIMILAGVRVPDRLNTQFFPKIALDMISVRVEWTGAMGPQRPAERAGAGIGA
jgi:multidrug efflux pump subunit AcrB